MKVATCFVIITTWYSNGRIIGQYYTVVYCSGGGGGGGGGGRGGGKDREQAKPQTPTKTDCERFVDGLVADGQKARNQVAGAWRLGLEYANKTFNAKVPIGKIGGFKDEFTRYGQGIEAYLHMYGVASGYLMGPGPGGLVSLYRSAADGLQLFDNESNGKGATRSLEAESELFGNKAGLDIGTALFNFINNDAASQTDLFKYLKGKLCK
jgi:hypothetical protein